MRKSVINRVLNLLLWMSFCAMAATGMLLAFRLPPGRKGGSGLTALGWSRHEWGDLHTWISYALLTLVALHILMHWRWLWHVAGSRFKSLVLAGLLAGLLAIGAVWLIPVRTPDGDRPGQGLSAAGEVDREGRGWRGGRGRE